MFSCLVPKHPLEDLDALRIDVEAPVLKMHREALETALGLSIKS
jgi:hypothetical protein